MQLHMLNWQCFRCLNVAQPGLSHEILIIQFANIFFGCQSHFATKKPSKRSMNYISQESEQNLATCSMWHWTPQRASDGFCRPLTVARKNLFGLLLTELQCSEVMLKGQPTMQLGTSLSPERWTHVQHQHMHELKRSCLCLFSKQGEGIY